VPKTLFEVGAIDQFDVSKDGRFLIKVAARRSCVERPVDGGAQLAGGFEEITPKASWADRSGRFRVRHSA